MTEHEWDRLERKIGRIVKRALAERDEDEEDVEDVEDEEDEEAEAAAAKAPSSNIGKLTKQVGDLTRTMNKKYEQILDVLKQIERNTRK